MNPAATPPETTDQAWMKLALQSARRALGRSAPNPPVGAVIVRDNQLLAEGHTQPPGQNHAEIDALARLNHHAPGATLYVTLEPCCHFGRTPPCTNAVLSAGITRVVIGTLDPFPLVAGKGVAQLQAAGVHVDVGILQEECQAHTLGFLRATLEGLPSITLKAAITLDGRIASETGESKWITGEEARTFGHHLRDTHDAILVGIQTVLADDPLLTTRLPGGHDPRPVVLDTTLRIPANAKILSRNPIIFCALDAIARDLPAQVIRVPRGTSGLDTEQVLRQLVQQGYHQLLAEGGGKLHQSLLTSGCVDRLEIFVNPRILAGGPSFVSGPGFSLAQAPRFVFTESLRLGDDLLLRLEKKPQ